MKTINILGFNCAVGAATSGALDNVDIVLPTTGPPAFLGLAE